MNLVIIAAVLAVAGAAKLDRTYLPPASAKTAGGSSESLQTPFAANSLTEASGGFPKGSFMNDFQGVVVDAALPGTRAAGEEETGLGGPRTSYGSTNSKVGDAAFRGTLAGFRQTPGNSQFMRTNQAADVETAGTVATPQGFSQKPGDFGGFEQGIGSQNSAQGHQNGFAQGQFNSQGFSQGPSGSQGHSSFASAQASVGSQPASVGSQPAGTNYQRSQALATRDREASILRFDSNVGTDSYSYSFETDNGISAEENGVATNGVHAQGGYSYTGDDGQVYSVTYTADEGGYQPKGDHLPTPPPIPVEILKSLEQNAREEAAGHVDDGSYDAQKYNAEGDYTENVGANIEHNRKPPTKFGNRPESDATASGTFISQSNQPFVRPSANALPGQGEETNAGSNVQGSNTFGSPQNVNSFNKFQNNVPSTNTQGNIFGSSSNSNFGQSNETPGNRFQQNSSPQKGTHQQLSSQSFTNQNVEVDDIRTQGHDIDPNSLPFDEPTGFNQQSTSDRKPSNSNSFGSLIANQNNFGQREQSSQPGFGSKKEYLPPVNNFGQNRRPSPTTGQRPGSFATSSQDTNKVTQGFTNSLPTSEQGVENVPQDLTSTSGSVTDSQSNTQFGSQNNKFPNGFKPNRFSSTQNVAPTQTEGKPGFSGSSINGPISQNTGFAQFQTQKATAQPVTELTTPFESSPNSQQNSGQTSATLGVFGSQSSQSRPTQTSFENNSHSNGISRFPTASSQSPNSRPFNTNNDQSSSFTGQISQSQKFNQGSGFTHPQSQKEGAQNQATDVQFASSTQRPTFSQNTQQAQGHDDSYYYNQPSKPFSTPGSQFQSSRFSSSSSNQFNRVSQQSPFASQTSAQASVSQQNFPINAFGSQNGPAQGVTRQPIQSAFSSPVPTSATQGSSGFNGITQATASSFTSGTPTAATQFGSQNSFSGFGRRPTQQPKNQFNNQISSQSQSQASQQSTAMPESFSDVNRNQFAQQNSFQNQQTHIGQQSNLNQATSSEDDSSNVPSQQYSGEIYEYAKPAETLPPSDEKEPSTSSGQFGNKQSSVTFGQSQQSQDSTTSQPENQPGLQGRPQFGSQPSRPQFGQQNQFSGQNTLSSTRPQFKSTTRFGNVQPTQPSFAQNFESQKTQQSSQFEVQGSGEQQNVKPQFGQRPFASLQSTQSGQFNQESSRFDQSRQRPSCCKTLPNAPQPTQGSTQGLSGHNQGQFGGQDSSVSSQGFKPDQSSAQSFAGKGEVFGGPRKPPSFDEQTGYHY